MTSPEKWMKMIEGPERGYRTQFISALLLSLTYRLIKSNPSTKRQSFTKARDQPIVFSAWQRPEGIPALAVIQLKYDFKCNSAFKYLQII